MKSFVFAVCVLVVSSVFAQDSDTGWTKIEQEDSFGDVTGYLKMHTPPTRHRTDNVNTVTGRAFLMPNDDHNLCMSFQMFRSGGRIQLKDRGRWELRTRVVVDGKKVDKTFKMNPQLQSYCDFDRATSVYLANHLKAGRDIRCNVVQFGSYTLGHDIQFTIKAKDFNNPPIEKL